MTELLLNIGELRKLFPSNTITLDDHIIPTGVCHDSRVIEVGEIFVALRGASAHADGHQHISAAFHAGASVVIAEENPSHCDNVLLCPDSLKGLQDLAHYYRGKFTQPLIAVTGSNGKTTTKDLLLHVLSAIGKIVATKGNLNNHIGVPLTIMNFNRQAPFFVVEMGMNHLEEIRTLARIARPTIGLITSVGHAHLEGVGGTIAGVARAKAELFEELDENCTAIINLDDPYIKNMPTRARRITYGTHFDAQIRAKDIVHESQGSRFILIDDKNEYPIKLKLTGQHHVLNALAAYAVGITVKVPVDQLLMRLESFTMETNRGATIAWFGHVWIDDSYNANPDSMRVSLESLCLRYPEKITIAVLGCMNELGGEAEISHYDIGRLAFKLGVKDLFVLGPQSHKYLEGFGAFPGTTAQAFSSHKGLAEALKIHLEQLSTPAAILVKGSRGYQMEKIFSELGIKNSKPH